MTVERPAQDRSGLFRRLKLTQRLASETNEALFCWTWFDPVSVVSAIEKELKKTPARFVVQNDYPLWTVRGANIENGMRYQLRFIHIP